MRRFLIVISFVPAAAVLLQASRSSPADSPSDQVLAAENARTTALVHDDLAALEKILGDDLTYVHASGKTDTKASLLEAIRSGQVHYISWTAKRLSARVIGDSAVIEGEYLVRVTDRRVKPDPFDVNIFILAVYARRAGRWQQIAWQSTRDVALSPPDCH
jgi:Domain of unknown function (DUF4440)